MRYFLTGDENIKSFFRSPVVENSVCSISGREMERCVFCLFAQKCLLKVAFSFFAGSEGEFEKYLCILLREHDM